MPVTALLKEDALIKIVKHKLAKASQFHIAMALVSDVGLREVLDDLEKALRRGATGEFLFGTDLPTHPDAISTLRDLATRYSGPFTLRRFASPAARSFHLKLWVFPGSAAIVGSSNLTKGGLADNYEADVIIEREQAVKDFADYFEALFHGAYGVPVTSAWLARYKAAWPDQQANQARARELRERTRLEPDVVARRKALPTRVKGNTFVFTGRIREWPRQARLYPYVERLGGRVGLKASALPKAAALVQGELIGGEDTVKLRLARELGSLVITQEEFFTIARDQRA